jgi:hypothetical protein
MVGRRQAVHLPADLAVFIDCHLAVIDIGDRKSANSIKIYIVGPALMIRVKITQERETVPVENCYSVVVDIGDGESLGIRRELDVMRIGDRGNPRGEKLDPEDIRNNLARQRYEEQTQSNDSEHGRLSGISISTKLVLR